MRISVPNDEWIARLLVVGIVLSMTRAFALTNALEVSLFLFVLSNGNLRSRVYDSLRDIRVVFVIMFWMWVGATSLWSEASALESFEEWWSWRKLFLVPICFALFDTEKSRGALALAIVGICSVFLFASLAGALGFAELSRSPSGLLENHSTQGVFFSYSAFICISSLRHFEKRLYKALALALALLFVSNVVFVATGRAGYLTILVLALFLVLNMAGANAKRALFGSFCALAIVVLMFVHEGSRQRILETWSSGWQEIETGQGALDSTSIRIFMWRNTVDVIAKHGWTGTGAGGFKAAYADVVSGYDDLRSVGIDDPHNQYLHIAAEHGVIGLIVFLLGVLGWVFGFLFSQPSVNVWSALGLGILLVTAVNSLSNGHFSSFAEGRLYWIAVASFSSGAGMLSINQVKGWVLRRVIPKIMTLRKRGGRRSEVTLGR